MFCRGLINTIVLITLIGLLVAESNASAGVMFTSVHDMEALAYQENRLMNTLSDYISNQPTGLKLILSTKLEQLANVRPVDQTVQHIIADPMNAFSLVRRLTREWPLILNLLVNNITIQEELVFLPKEEVMESAVRGLMRLQVVYELNTTELAQQGTSSVLTALGCFEMGKYLFRENKYEVAKSWFSEALEKIAKGDTTVLEDKVLVHLFLASQYSDCEDGTKSGSASSILQYLMSQYPEYSLDQDSAQLFKQALSGDCPKRDQSANTEMMSLETFYNRAYSQTCRGIGLHFSSTLRCFYINYNNPRLLIAPFKMEELHLNPPVLMFHDVVLDHEIEEMKTVFSKVRERCVVVDDDHVGKVRNHRTCDVGWVEDHAVDSSARLTRRVGDMTNLSMKYSDHNQVASYGLGGEFLLHYDSILIEDLSNSTDGRRIATLMFYLNDVDSGGFTVFPRINVAVRPQKGSAVFWFNLNHRSEPLDDMLHGGCPILRGSKWVLNKWIYEGGQKGEMFCPSDEMFPKKRYYLNGKK